jgi:SAM-dependent methyltransferase
MSSDPLPAPANPDFEFGALAEAINYRRAIADEFAGFIRGNVLEVGAGIGQFTTLLRQLTGIERVVAIEPDLRLAAQHRLQFPDHQVIDGFIADAPPGVAWNAIVSVNVLEHIESDAAELGKYSSLLGPTRGHLCLFVPARQEIYAPIDKDFGHFRRYNREDVRASLESAQFEVLQVEYFNLLGYFAWWLNFCVLKKRSFERSKVRFFDRHIFPRAHQWEVKHWRPPFGQSVIAVARAKGS